MATDYFFTVTLQPKMYKFTADEQYDKTVNELLIILRILSEKFTVVTELTKSANVHWHGIIQMGDKKTPFVNMFRGDSQFGFINISPIKSMEQVYNYIRKDLENTSKELNRRSILQDKYNVFSNKERLLYGTQF